MTEESSSSSSPSTTAATPTPAGATPATTWELPAGIEDDIEQALIKTAAGALAGGLLGLVFLRSGKGRRSAAIATGIGAGLGSTYERVKFRYADATAQKE